MVKARKTEITKICPACGSKMKRLARATWTCKCGHREVAEPMKERQPDETADKAELKPPRTRFWEDKKQSKDKRKDLLQRKEVLNRKKRTSAAG